MKTLISSTDLFQQHRGLNLLSQVLDFRVQNVVHEPHLSFPEQFVLQRPP